MGWFFSFLTKIFDNINFLLCTFEIIIIIKGIVYIQCEMWAIKLSFLRKALSEFVS